MSEEFLNPEMSRRTWFKTVATLAASTAVGRVTKAKEEKRCYPRGTLVPFGGNVEKADEFIVFAAEMGIDIKKPDGQEKSPEEIYEDLVLDDPKKLEVLTKECDFAGVFAEIARFFVKINEGNPFDGATVVCVTSAADETRNEAGEIIKTEQENADENARHKELFFKLLGANEVVSITNKEQANDDYNGVPIEEIIRNTRDPKDPKDPKDPPKRVIIYLAGGVQKNLVDKFSDTKAHMAMLDCYQNDPNFIVIGNSAGAAAMPANMIQRWNEKSTGPDMVSGLRFLSSLIIDTHIRRNPDFPRLPRLQVAVNKAASEGRNGIGLAIDEETGVIIRNGEATVIGRHSVWKVEPDGKNYHIDIPDKTELADKTPEEAAEYVSKELQKMSRELVRTLPTYKCEQVIDLGKHGEMPVADERTR